MDKVSMVFRVLFVEPFWIGVIERVSDNQLEVCKITFGVEPQDQEVLQWVFTKYPHLTFSPAVNVVTKDKKRNPKRRQREIQKDTSPRIGTKSQQALKLLHEESKIVKKEKEKVVKKKREELQFQMKQQKRKEKHRGK